MLKGDPSLCKSLVSLKTMMKMICNEGNGYLVELQNLVLDEQEGSSELATAVLDEQEDSSDCDMAVQEVLTRFKEVFHMPEGLPPICVHEHAIVLK